MDSRVSEPEGFDVTALGELVIDLVPAATAEGGLNFTAKPGGAPGNVAAGVARLGLKAAMLSRVGPGALGDLLIDTLAGAGVDTAAVGRAVHEPTALAVVAVSASGERDFALYREGCADAALGPEDVPLALIRSSRVLHVGSLSLATPQSGAAQRLAVATAQQAGTLVSADVNFRPAFWRNRDAMLGTGREAVAGADIVKVSAEELALLGGTDDVAAAAAALWHPRLRLLAVTHGAAGAELFTPRDRVAVPGFAVPVVDTVGCGDAFMAALLAGLLELDGAAPTAADLRRIGQFASAAGAVMAGVAGAMQAMPTRPAIAALLAG